jgi:hypothetical protein
MDVVTLAPFRAPVLAEVMPASGSATGPTRVELKVEIVASQPPPPPSREIAPAAVQLAPRRELPPSAAFDLPLQRSRAIGAYSAVEPLALGLVVDLRA